ncbi:Cytochrome P450 [Niveomyces insectorum RCEF 264]|uniref:Cytochrome P450 n=1 Tax=Niveomyces insectorum RCEF 264 TaxID=1081102 RepID=A0A167W6W0_9HYPO|nr:Cytochrome P450 [Niveomyces insectorum RCEF 264]
MGNLRDMLEVKTGGSTSWLLDHVSRYGFFTVGCVAIVSMLSVYVVYQRFFSPLAKVKGPFLASLTPFWKLQKFNQGNFHETILALHQKYGPVVRIGPTEVIISDKVAVKEIYSTVQGRDFLKTDYYDAFTAFRPTIFGQRDPHLHAQRKRIVSHGYSMSALQAMEKYVQERLQLFMRKMSFFSTSGEVFNLAKWCHFFAFDVIGELAFSEGFGMLESGIEDEHIRLINNQMEFGSTIGMVPWAIPFTKWTFLPIPWLRNLQAGRERLKELTRSRVERRREKVSDRKDLLGRLIEAKDPVTGQMLDAIDLRTEAFSSIVAGSDSTSSALGYTFYHILGHPDVYRTLTKELIDAFPGRKYSTDSHPPTYAELGRLPYLQACIKEALRITPPATINLPRYVPQGGRVVAGTYLPEKTTVGMSALPVHMDPATFGSDCDRFNPSRWIDGTTAPDGSHLAPEEMTRYWIPFGQGSRQCIGKNVAMLELIKLVGTLLLYFDISVQPNTNQDEKSIHREVPVSKSYFFARMDAPLDVTITERK